MAKAKSSGSGEKASDKSAKKAPPKKAAKAKSGGGSSLQGAPMVDTNRAAQAAAQMLVSGRNRKSGGAATPESSMFKNLKAGIARPHAAGLDNILDKSAPAEMKKSNLPFNNQNNQVGHNQTYGADVSRVNVPRRTAG
jgi:hypothetical protein